VDMYEGDSARSGRNAGRRRKKRRSCPGLEFLSRSLMPDCLTCRTGEIDLDATYWENKCTQL
jgi:hypothetical protein